MTMGQRVAILDHGVLQQVDAPQDVYDRPANLFVARFIGTPPMNTLTATFASTNGRVGVRVGETVLAIPERLGAAIAGTDPKGVVLGLRPEHAAIAPDGELAATVELVEHLGHERHVMTRTDDGQELVVRQGADRAVPSMGETVRIRVPADCLHCFDAESGARIEAS
jgi:ABC-type sugar transport system ATPase subunit